VTKVLNHLVRYLFVSVLFCAFPLAADDTQPITDRPLKIGTIGAGNLGGTIGELLAKAGHQVFFSSRHPDELQSLVERAGPNARAGTVSEAIEFGEVILLAVPYGAMPQISRDYADALAGKIVLDAGNPFPSRDGPMAETALKKGAGVATAEYLPGARIVRAFNSINYRTFASEAHSQGDKLTVPLASDDGRALDVASQLVRDAGFESVIAGSLEQSRHFDNGSSLFLKTLTAEEMRKALHPRSKSE